MVQPPERGSNHTQVGAQCERGSAFPDVCCSFDLLLQLKLHPPPASLACSRGNLNPRTVTTPSSLSPSPSPACPHRPALLPSALH
uniref:Uncharacterized protein n=1 Tax=Knipowitschia caucasica TaxID=637954 RepID=A0AAV2JQF3_KNICA